MPEISRFFGIIIRMFFRDHNPPHFHVAYNEFRATIAIEELSVIAGEIPPTALTLVRKWATQHRQELLENWDAMATGYKKYKKIQPMV